MRRKFSLAFLILSLSLCMLALGIQWRAEQRDLQFIQAVRNRETALALQLLDAGADPNTMQQVASHPLLVGRLLNLLQRSKNGASLAQEAPRSVLALAFTADEPEVIKALLQHGATDVDAVTQAPGSFMPRPLLMIAADSGYREIVNLLLQRGAAPNIVDESGHTALDEAVIGDDVPMAVSLLNHHAMLAPPHAPPAIQYTPQLDMLKLLVAHGASIHATNDAGQTLLMLETYAENINCVRYLLEQGADVYQRDCAGNTALDYARRHYDSIGSQIVQMIQQAMQRHNR